MQLGWCFRCHFQTKILWLNAQCLIFFCIPNVYGARWTIRIIWWNAYFQMINDCIKMNRQNAPPAAHQLQTILPLRFFAVHSIVLFPFVKKKKFWILKTPFILPFPHMNHLLSYFQCRSNIRSQSSNHRLQLSIVHVWKFGAEHAQTVHQWPDDLLIKTVLILLRFLIAMKKQFFVFHFFFGFRFKFAHLSLIV